MKKIKLAVVDDQELFRRGIISLLKENEELSVVIEAQNGKELVDAMKRRKPNIVLLDIEMPIMDGIATTEYLHATYPDVKILILTMHDDDEFVIHLIDKGAHGFLLKNNSIDVVVDAIYSIMGNGYYFNDHVSKMMIKGLVRSKKIKPNFNPVNLSDREIEVIKLICKEHTTSEISTKLCLSVRTVDNHRESILEKTGARNVAGIVMFAIKNNLL
ncbi:MAG: response regulator transcription factor [Bacteroidetes bacterium]|nr:response regulator transcription factor [Bacteroidota bacterium]